MTRERLLYSADHAFRANRDLLRCAETLTPAQLDTAFDLAMGTLRRQLGHMASIEHFWFVFLSTGRYAFRGELASGRLEAIKAGWAETELIARVYIGSLTDAEMARCVKPLFRMPDAPPMTVADACAYIFESSMERREHALEMLRRLGAPAFAQTCPFSEMPEPAF